MSNLLAIACGGALGAVCRYLMMGLFIGITFPLGTIVVNALGSFTFGALLELNALKLNLPEVWRIGLFVGFLGAFTTFSTFSMDVVYLLQKDQLFKAMFYIGLSVVLSVTLFYAGMRLSKVIFG